MRPAVELLSLYPTLVDLCGLPANTKLEGVGLRALLENPGAAWEHVALSTLGQNNHAVRDRRWRYIRYADGSEELYDHKDDPNEWRNLAAKDPLPEHATVIKRLKAHLPRSISRRGTDRMRKNGTRQPATQDNFIADRVEFRGARGVGRAGIFAALLD